MIKDFEIRRLCWILQAGPKYVTSVLIRGGGGRFDRNRRGEGRLTTEAEIPATQPKPGCQPQPEPAEPGMASPWEPAEGSNVLLTPWFQPRDTDFGLPASRMVRE